MAISWKAYDNISVCIPYHEYQMQNEVKRSRTLLEYNHFIAMNFLLARVIKR